MHGRNVLLLLDNASSRIRSFKARYKRKFVRWLLDALHAGAKRNINILESVRFAIESWEEVPAQAIRNCWLHCNIIDPVTAAALAQESEYQGTIEPAVETELVSMIYGISCSGPVADYINIDLEASTETDPDIIERQDVDMDDNDDSDADERPLLPSPALDCCVQLAAFMARHANCDSEVKALGKVADFIRAQCIQRKTQTSISQFFENSIVINTP